MKKGGRQRPYKALTAADSRGEVIGLSEQHTVSSLSLVLKTLFCCVEVLNLVCHRPVDNLFFLAFGKNLL